MCDEPNCSSPIEMAIVLDSKPNFSQHKLDRQINAAQVLNNNNNNRIQSIDLRKITYNFTFIRKKSISSTKFFVD